MIVRIKTRIASHIQHYLTHVTHISMQYRFSFAFSDIKKKADHFMCAATAIMTILYNRPIQTRMVKYGKNRFIQNWQKDMNLVFWFELESALLNPIFESQKTKQCKKTEYFESPNQQQFWKSDKIEALNYLKYYYYYLVFYGELKTTYFWSGATRYKYIHQIIKSIIYKEQSKERALIKQIVAILAEQKQKKNTQYKQNNQILSKFKQIIKELRFKVNQVCQKQHQEQFQRFSKKQITDTTRYLRSVFAMELLQLVKTFQETGEKYGEKQVVINHLQISKIAEKIKFYDRKIYFDELVNRSLAQVKRQNYKPTMTFNYTLQEIKTQLNAQVSRVSLKIFMTQLMMDKFTNSKEQLAEKRLISFLTSRDIYIQVKGGVNQKFNIKNQLFLQYTSFQYFTMTERNKQARLKKEIEQKQTKGSKKKKQQVSSTKYNKENKTRAKPEGKKKGETVDTVWSHIFQLFTQKNKGIQNLTFAASPVTKTSKFKGQEMTNAINNPYFDLVLIKKNQSKEKPFKVVGIDVVVGEQQKNYTNKLQNIIQFKKYIVLNNLEFFGKIKLEIWILCPQRMAKPNSQQWVQEFQRLKKQFDQTNKSKSVPLILKIVSFEDINIIGQLQVDLQEQYAQFCQYIKQMNNQNKKQSNAENQK